MKKATIFSLILLITMFILPEFASAETIILKSGRKVRGKIIDRTDGHIKVDLYDVSAQITYPLKDVERIEGGEQSAPPSVEEIATSEPSAKTIKTINEINSYYYSYIDMNIESIRWVHNSSGNDAFVAGLKQRGTIDLAKKVESIRFIATYKPLTDTLVIEVNNKDLLKELGKNEYLKEYFNSRTHALGSLWDDLKDFQMILIDLNDERVESIKYVNEDLIVETIDQEGNKTIRTFDKNYYLKLEELFEVEPLVHEKRTFDFEICESKYLVKTMKSNSSNGFKAKIEISYQIIDGINVPKDIMLFGKFPEEPAIEEKMFFSDVEVKFAD